MSSALLPLVAAEDISRLVGPAAANRGRTYARNGAVMQPEWDAAASVLRGSVAGTAARPYRCRVTLVSGRGEYLRPADGVCDCPVGGDCKHVAALLFESNRLRLREMGTAADLAEAGAAEGGSRQARSTAADRSAEGARSTVGAMRKRPSETVDGAQPGADWRSALTRDGSDTLPVGAQPLGLLFELRQLQPQRHRWQGPTASRAVAPLTAQGDYRLAVRPVLLSRTRNWVTSGISWGTLSYAQQRLGLDPAHHRWFTQFGALQRSTRELFAAQEQDRLYLDDFDSPLLWPMLAEADELGIALVSGKKDTRVRLADVATVSLSATADADGLRLDTVLSVGGETIDAAAARPIGDHGVYVCALDPHPSFHLAPTSAPLNDEQRRALARPVVVIPATDVREFVTDFYPRLGRSIAVSGADDLLPELRPPELVLTASFEPANVLRLGWHWTYDGVARPLDPGAGDAEVRDAAAERSLRARAEQIVGHELDDRRLRGIDAARFSAEILPVLGEEESILIEIVGEQPDYRELTEAPHLTVTATESDRRDWFDLGILVTVEGRTIPFVPLFTALTKGQQRLLLADSSYLALDRPEFDELRRLIAEASELGEWETTPRISRYQAQLWADFEDLADETVAATSWRDAARGLLDTERIDHLTMPPGMTAELRPYQHDGFDWLAFLHRHRMGGILADDMGLGKTLQALALIAHTREADAAAPPFLVVAPTSVMSNWAGEARRYTPTLETRTITATEGKAQTSVADVVRGADVVVTSYALFRLDFAAYQRVEWSGLILDEAQFVKNPASIAHRCAVDLDAPVKFALTGTPLENSLLDLWALFAIVAPGLFPSKRRFTEDYVQPIAQRESPEHAAARTEVLRRRIRPLMMRRTKELVASELPAKQEQTLRVELAPAHRALYDTYLQRERQKLLGLVADLDRNRFIVFRSLTLLRMLSLDASLIDDEHSGIPSAKLDALLEHLGDVVSEGHRALVFSQFTSFLKLAAGRLDAAGIAYEYLDGSTLKRAEVIERFRSGAAPVFLISLKAGGFGLNLTEADYVFLLDPWWNPAAEAQAVDRTHRIGQTRPVNVYRMVSSGTIEEKVMALRDAKAALFDAVMEDDAVFSSALTADDIRGLLED